MCCWTPALPGVLRCFDPMKTLGNHSLRTACCRQRKNRRALRRVRERPETPSPKLQGPSNGAKWISEVGRASKLARRAPTHTWPSLEARPTHTATPHIPMAQATGLRAYKRDRQPWPPLGFEVWSLNLGASPFAGYRLLSTNFQFTRSQNDSTYLARLLR